MYSTRVPQVRSGCKNLNNESCDEKMFDKNVRQKKKKNESVLLERRYKQKRESDVLRRIKRDYSTR